MLAVLGLFTIESPEWTVEEAAESLGASVSTTYRYFRALTKVGLLSPVSRAGYMLGPAIIELDRQIQKCDLMLRASRGVMADLIGYAPDEAIILLCRLFHDRVICVHQVFGRGPHEPVSYERGRPMPLFRGATSKIILANLPPHTLKVLFSKHAHEIAAAGLGTTGTRSNALLPPCGATACALPREKLMRDGSGSPLQFSVRNKPSLAASVSFYPLPKLMRLELHAWFRSPLRAPAK